MNIKDVENLAELARIELTEEEKVGLLKDMEGILAYVKQIEAAELSENKTQAELYNVWREDEPQAREFSRDLILEQFPSSQDGFVKVKKIL